MRLRLNLAHHQHQTSQMQPAAFAGEFVDRSLEVLVEDVIRSSQTQRGNGQRWIGGRNGRERAAADQVEILVVVRALDPLQLAENQNPTYANRLSS
jgi:hypothetical protein